MMSTFTGAAIIPAFEDISVDLGVSLPKTAYLTSLTIAILAVAPMMWRPLCDKYGRRPIFLLSLICSLVGNIGCAKSPTYATMALCRAIVMFFLCPPASVGSGVVTETFFRKDRARYIGIWTLMVTLGVPISPFIMGFVANNIGYRWIYWILAIVSSEHICHQTKLMFHRSTVSSLLPISSLGLRPATFALAPTIKGLISNRNISILLL
jgi:MFS family permease